jgi:NAD(P)-dependent dehydrogenase (short-subunit alcohol dehydrogenase family)
MGRKSIALVGDVSDQGLVESMVARCKDELGAVSILVSNAAYSDRELF